MEPGDSGLDSGAIDAFLVGYARVSTTVSTRRLSGDTDVDVQRLADELAVHGWDFQPTEGQMGPRGGNDESLFLDRHESLGASRIPEVLAQGTIVRADGHQSPWHVARLAVGNTGVAALAVPIVFGLGETDLLAALHDSEQSLHGEVAGLLALVERCLTAQIGELPDRDYVELPAGKLLWWHRVVIVPFPDHVPAGHGSFGLEIKLDGDIQMLVGDGYSYLVGEFVDAEVVAQALRGILLATEDWLGLDSINRRISYYLSRLPRVSDDRVGVRELEKLAVESLEFTIELDALQLYLEERNRYLAVGRRAVWMAARSKWGIEDEMGNLRERSDAAGELAASLRNEMRGRVDRARNTLLFVLAFAAIIQVLLIGFDFSTAGSPGHVSAFRLTFTLTVSSLAAILAMVSVRRWR